MKKIINTVTAAIFAMFTITAVSAQHGHRGSYGGGGRGGHSVAHVSSHASFASRAGAYGRNVAYRGGGYAHYGRPAYGGRVAYGGAHYARPMGGRRAFVPWGAAHRYAYGRPVYFPAYHLYYDPYRCGYEYWSGGRWLFSVGLPSFLAGIDLAAADMAYAGDLPPVAYYPPAPVAVAPVGVNIHIGL